MLNGQRYGFKSDIWSFGCLVFSLVTGQGPFQGQNVQETLKNLKNKKMPNLEKILDGGEISQKLEDLLKNMICLVYFLVK